MKAEEFCFILNISFQAERTGAQRQHVGSCAHGGAVPGGSAAREPHYPRISSAESLCVGFQANLETNSTSVTTIIKQCLQNLEGKLFSIYNSIANQTIN